jgi:hypothetical protein
MKCKDVRKKLLFYLDNELAVTDKQAIELHLSGCPVCQKELEALSATQNILRQVSQEVSTKVAPHWAWFELQQRFAMLQKPRPAIGGRVLSRVRAFVSGQPRWKPILSGVLVLAIIVSSILFIPALLGPSPEALATEITADDTGVEAVLQGEPVIHATKISATQAYLVSQGPSSDFVFVYVDLAKRTVTRMVRFGLPQLTEEDVAKVIDIAKPDYRVQQVLNQGFTIRSVSLLPTRFRLEVSEAEPRVWIEGMLADIALKADGLTWIARVDLAEKRVVNVFQLPTPRPLQSWFHISYPYSLEELINMARTDAQAVELLNKGAKVVSAVAGGEKVEDKGAMILSLGEDRWVVRLDLAKRIVTDVDPVPAGKWDKGYFFKP